MPEPNNKAKTELPDDKEQELSSLGLSSSDVASSDVAGSDQDDRSESSIYADDDDLSVASQKAEHDSESPEVEALIQESKKESGGQTLSELGLDDLLIEGDDSTGDNGVQVEDKEAGLESRESDESQAVAETEKEIEGIEVIKPGDMTDAQRQETRDLDYLHGMLDAYLENDLTAAALFPDGKSREEFREKLKLERGVKAEDGSGYEKLPEFGEASKEGLSRLADYYEKLAVPLTLRALKENQLEPPAGVPMTIAGERTTVLTLDRYRQAVEREEGRLDIDPENVSDIGELRGVNDWIDQSNRSMDDLRLDRQEAFLSDMLEEGIRDGKFPPGWRRNETNLDQVGWVNAVDQAMSTYDRTTRLMESLVYLKNSNVEMDGVEELVDDAFKNLPPGMKPEDITWKDGKITRIDFSSVMLDSLSLEDHGNKQKLGGLEKWCQENQERVQPYFQQLLKTEYVDGKYDICGYGEMPVSHGWVNTESKEFVANSPERPREPEGGWKHFNLIEYDMDYKAVKDEFGKLVGYEVTPTTEFREIHPLSYDDWIGETAFEQKGKSTFYELDKPVAVQNSSGQIELVAAKDLPRWKSWEQTKHVGHKAVMYSMDALMVASAIHTGGASLAVARTGGRLLAEKAAVRLGTSVVGQMPRNYARWQMAKAVSQFAIGVGGFTHNPGAQEIPELAALGHARSMYFLGHAGLSLTGMLRGPAGRFLASRAPATLERLNSVRNTFGGGEELARNAQLIEEGLKISHPLMHRAGELAHGGFWASEQAFVGMFLMEGGHFVRGFTHPERPQSVVEAEKAYFDSLGPLAHKSGLEGEGSSGSDYLLEQTREDMMSPSAEADWTGLYFERYARTLGINDPAKMEQVDSIVDGVKKYIGDDADPAEREAFVRDLMKFFRYDGDKIASLQDGKFKRDMLSEKQVQERSTTDPELDPDLKRVAGLAALVLTRAGSEDGKIPEILAERQVDVGTYTEKYRAGAGRGGRQGPVQSRKVDGPDNLEQQLSAKEVLSLIGDDFMGTEDSALSADKAAVLYEAGVVSGEQLGSILTDRIMDKELTAEDRMKAVADLGRVITRLRLEEVDRATNMSADQYKMARGMAFGLSSGDLTRELQSNLGLVDDPDVRATAEFMLNYLNKSQIDGKDQERFKEAFWRVPPGVTHDDLSKILEEDLMPPAKDAGFAAWERHLIAAETLGRRAWGERGEEGDDKKALDAFFNSMGLGEEGLSHGHPIIAARAFRALSQKEAVGSDLIRMQPESQRTTYENKLRSSFLSIWPVLRDDPSKPDGERDRTAVARAAYLSDASSYLSSHDVPAFHKAGIQRHLLNTLSGTAGSGPDPYMEVRVAALEGLSKVSPRSDETAVGAIVARLDVENEPSEAVRLAALDALERVEPRGYKRVEHLQDLIPREDDPVVATRLAKYNRPGGSILDRSSAVSLEAQAELIRVQNQLKLNPEEADQYLSRNYGMLLAKDNLLKYAPHRSQQYNRMHEANEYFKHSVHRSMVTLEMFAQNWAHQNYSRELSGLLKLASGDNDSLAGRVGTQSVGGVEFSAEEGAILALGSLLRNGSQMGEIFHRRRLSDENNAHDNARFRDYSEAELRQRRSDTLSIRVKQSQGNLTAFESDPWEGTELKIAKAMTALSTRSADSVNLELLRKQMMIALQEPGNENQISPSKALPETRIELLNGLDRMISQEGFDPEVKSDVVEDIARNLSVMDLSREGKDKVALAMLDFIDKHAPSSFYKFSPESAAVRTALTARGDEDSYRTPDSVRLRAQEIFSRRWDSVFEMARSIEPDPSRLSAHKRAELLPTDLESLYTDARYDGKDERIDDAVRQIIASTRGHKVAYDDPVHQQLSEFIYNPDFDEKITLAAAYALQQGGDHYVATRGLVDLINRSDNATFRQEAASLLTDNVEKEEAYRLLERSDSMLDQELVTELERLKVSVEGDAESGSASTLDLVRAANGFIAENLDKPESDRLKSVLARVGEHYSATGDILSHYRERERATSAYELALEAYGIEPDSIKDNASFVTRNYYRPYRNEEGELVRGKVTRTEHEIRSSEETISARRDALIKRHDDTGTLPAVARTLTNYAAERVHLFGVTRKDGTAHNNAAVGGLALARSLNDSYFGEDTLGAARAREHLGRAYHLAAEVNGRLGVALATPIYYEAGNRFREMNEMFENYAEKNPDDSRIENLMSVGRALELSRNTAVAIHGFSENSPMTKLNLDYYIETALAHPAPESSQYHLNLGRLNALASRNKYNQEKREEFLGKTDEHIDRALVLAADGGVNTRAYLNTVLLSMHAMHQLNRTERLDSIVEGALSRPEVNDYVRKSISDYQARLKSIREAEAAKNLSS